MEKGEKYVWEKHIKLWKEDFYAIDDKTNNILNWLKKLPRGTVLDEGCSIGQWTITLSKLGFRAVGIDFSEKLLSIARKKAKKHKARCKFLKGDIRKLPFRNNSFDIVLSPGVVEHVKETELCIKEIARVLKNKGYLIMNVPHKISIFTINKILQKAFGIWKAGYEKSFTKPYIRRLLKKNGFRILDEITNKIEPKTFVTKILYLLDMPLYAIGLGGHHVAFFCKKVK